CEIMSPRILMRSPVSGDFESDPEHAPRSRKGVRAIARRNGLVIKLVILISFAVGTPELFGILRGVLDCASCRFHVLPGTFDSVAACDGERAQHNCVANET